MIAYFTQQGEHELVMWHMHAQKHICEERIRQRASRQNRMDDADPEVIERRLSVYFDPQHGLRQTLVPYLADQCDVHVSLDGNGDLEKVVRPMVINELAPRVYPSRQVVLPH